MDEKGFMISVLSRSKPVFSRQLWEKKEVTAALQDESCERVTLLAAICADGEVLPPSIIYASKTPPSATLGWPISKLESMMSFWPHLYLVGAITS